MRQSEQKKCIQFNTEEGEIWKDIPGFPCYKASSHGRIASFRGKTAKILRPTLSHGGYYLVTVALGDRYGEGGQKTISVHRLVALAFIPNPENKPCIDHINTIRTDNRPSNLRYVTAMENSANPITKVRMKAGSLAASEKTSRRVYVYDDNLNEVSAFTSTAEAARITKSSQGNISSCCMASLPRYKGRIWSYTRLSSMDERKALEDSVKEKFNRNRASSINAGKKWQNRNRQAYQEKCRNYYYLHKEEIMRKRKEKYDREKKKTNDR